MSERPPVDPHEEPTAEIAVPPRRADSFSDRAGYPAPRRAPAAPGWLRVCVVVLCVLFALALAGLALEKLHPSALARLRNQGLRQHATRVAPGPAATFARRRSASSTTSRPPAGPSASGAPRLSSLKPASGPSGTRVTLQGTGFMSANGHVLVYFGAVPAPTNCPSVSRCLATAPAAPAGGAVAVRLHTASGVSNAETFTYR